MSLDIETGGNFICQLSAEIFCIVYNDNPKAELNICHSTDVFNEYINPGNGVWWDPMCARVHGLPADSSKIVNADHLFHVWNRFTNFIDLHMREDDVGIILAYNGET